MKKFMLIFLGSDYQTLGLSPEEMQGRMGKWFAWNQKMQDDGVYIDGHALESKTVILIMIWVELLRFVR